MLREGAEGSNRLVLKNGVPIFNPTLFNPQFLHPHFINPQQFNPL